jgi:hypothetical protein
MKRIFLTLTLAALVLPVFPKTASADISIDFFYNNLSGGNWIEVADYGYCWQPDVTVNDPSWRPYSDGYWAYTDVGWTWVSYEDFGWATYHYGRWARLADYGWVWVPGADLEWGPAWVSWRTGGDYIGWAPLPPRGPGIVYESQPIGGAVDVEFDIGPEYYNFCDVRYIGEPVLRERIVDVRQNVTYINQTVNVTNITVKNQTVYNYGPDINVVNQRSSRPIQRLHLERQQNADVATAARSGAITKVQGNNLVVAAPMRITKPAQTVAPPRVKARVTQPKVEKGWTGINPTEQAKLKEKIKTEDRTKVPPPTTAGGPATGQAGVGTAAGPSPGTPAPAVGAKGKRGPGEHAQAAGSPSPGTSPIGAAGLGRHRGRHGEQLGTPPPAGPTEAGAESAATPPVSETGKPAGKHGEEAARTPAVTGAPTEPGHRHGERGKPGFTPAGAGSAGETLSEPPGRRRHNEPGGNARGTGQGTENLGTPQSEARGGRHRPEVGNQPPAGTQGGAAGAPAGQGRQQAKPKHEKGSPSPGPQ